MRYGLLELMGDPGKQSIKKYRHSKSDNKKSQIDSSFGNETTYQ